MLCVAPQIGVGEEVERIQAVFGLPADAPLPAVNLHTLDLYRDYLLSHLAFPFEALCAEKNPPVRHLVRYIRVLGLREVAGHVSEGLLCDVEGIPHVKRLLLAEIGIREDNENHQLVDDYAYWFYNYR